MNPSVSISRIRIEDMMEAHMNPTVVISRMDLASNVELKKSEGMTKEELTKLTIIQKFEKKCAICLNEFEDGEDLRCLVHCSHVFHLECVDEWLKDNRRCPMCRQFL